MQDGIYNGVDLFAGAGGLSLGAEMAGINVVLAIEKDISASLTYSYNHKDTKVVNRDIKSYSDDEISHLSNIDILFGGPPCQGFSTLNRRTNNSKNPQNWLYKEFIRFLNILQPNWVVLENVKGLLELNSREFSSLIVEDFRSAGYTCSFSVLDAALFGIPQYRKRFFLVGSKKGRTIDLSCYSAIQQTTVYDALFDLPILENGACLDIQPYQRNAISKYSKTLRGSLNECSGNLVSRNEDYILERYKCIKQGENWKAIPQELMDNYTDFSRCHTGIYYRLREDKPSKVIANYRKNMLIHPWSDRGLSVREAARLQSFPDAYRFFGNLGHQQQQIGNAVPPMLAKYVFDVVLSQS